MSLDRIDAAPLTRALNLLGLAGPGKRGRSRAIALDMAERALIASLFVSFAHRMLADGARTASLGALLAVLSEALPFFFVLFRAPAKSLSLRPGDWLIAITATVAPLLVQPAFGGSATLVGVTVGYGLMMAGLFVQVSAKIMLGRRFGLVPANRGVRMLGPYRFVRHPMYAGYTITHIGFLVAMPSPLNAAIYAFALAMQLLRIAREEAVLMQDPLYSDYAGRVRYRLFPGLY